MTFYEKELHRIRGIVYANESQVNTVIATRNYIETHYDADLNLDVLAHIQRISKYHLLRLFKKYYGLTPRQYVMDIRIERSKKYLRTGMAVTETCFAVGFKSLGSFSALFKRKTGKTPTQFRKEQLSRSNLPLDSATCEPQS